MLGVLLWPILPLVPSSGLDNSWNAALAMAFHSHVPLGTHPFVFGPLGALQVPGLWYVGTAIVAEAFWFFLGVLVLAAVLWSLRRSMPLWAAIVLTYLLGGLVVRSERGSEFVLGVAAIWCVAALVGEIPERWLAWWWVGMWGAASFFLLAKRDVGAVLVGMLIVTLACSPYSAGRLGRLGAIGIGTFVGTFWIGWTATGNALGAVPRYFRATFELFHGYAGAMSLEARPDSDLISAGLMCGLLAALVATDRRLRTAKVRVGASLMVAGSTWALVREEFVRHDVHAATFFSFAVLLVMAFRPGRRPLVPLLSALAVAGVSLVIVVGLSPVAAVDPIAGLHAGIDQGRTLLSAKNRTAVMASARSTMGNTYSVPPAMLAEIAGKTVDIDPWEQAVAWVYPSMRWDPLPVLQDYSAYTTWLDNLDVAALHSPSAPQMILRQSSSAIDGRDQYQDPPSTQLAILCNYRQVDSSPGWQLLQQSTDRCSSPSLLATVHVDLGQQVAVPQPVGLAVSSELIVASVSQVPMNLADSLQGLLMKPPIEHLNLDDAPFRLVAGTASDLHLMGSPLDLAWSPTYAPTYVHSMSVTVEGEPAGTPGVTVQFYALRVRP